MKGKKGLDIVGELFLLPLGVAAFFRGLTTDTRKPFKADVSGVVFLISGLGAVIRVPTGEFDE